MNDQPERRPFRIDIVCEDVSSPAARMGVLAGTAEALCRATKDEASAGIYCLIWAAIHIAEEHAGVPPEKIVAMVSFATASILGLETDDPAADTGPGLH